MLLLFFLTFPPTSLPSPLTWSLSLSLSVSLSHFQSLSVYLISVSLSFSFSLVLSQDFSIFSVSLTVFTSLLVSHFVLSLSISLSFCFTFSSLYLSLSLYISYSRSPSLLLYVSVSLHDSKKPQWRWKWTVLSLPGCPFPALQRSPTELVWGGGESPSVRGKKKMMIHWFLWCRKDFQPHHSTPVCRPATEMHLTCNLFFPQPLTFSQKIIRPVMGSAQLFDNVSWMFHPPPLPLPPHDMILT